MMVSPRINVIILLIFIMLSLASTVVYPQFLVVVHAQEPEQQPPANMTETNTTASPPSENQIVTEEKEWWEIGPTLIQYPERIVGFCYPWLILEHFIVNLPSGETYPGTGGDTALEAYCGDNYFIVKAVSGVYVFRKDTGNIFKTIHLSEHMWFIGAKKDTVAIYDSLGQVVYIKNIEGESDTAIPINHVVLDIDYDIIDGIPVVVYSSPANTTTYYFVATPAEERMLDYTGTGAVLINDNTIYLESNGLKVLRITSVVNLHVEEEGYIPFPFTITGIHKLIEDRLLVSSYDVLISINVENKTFELIGSAIPTPVGYYVPDAKTTYVITPSGIYPVPGYGVGLFSDVGVFTDIPKENETIPVFWPLRTTVFIAKINFDGILYAGEYGMKLTLQPGTYRLPMGAILRYDSFTILLDKDEVEYPEEATLPPTSPEIPSVNYTVAEFPEVYIPVDTITGVEKVYVGGGRALLVQRDKAIVYSEYGISAVIPGTWKFGGLGKCVVLYDGASFRLYDFAGNHLTNYQYYITTTPDYIACDIVNGKYEVKLYIGRTEYIISGGKVETKHYDAMTITDPTSGLLVRFTTPIEIELSGFEYSLPPDASNVYLNKYTVSWSTGTSLYILSIKYATVYTLTNTPANKTFYPLGNYLLMYDAYNEKVEVLAYKSWLVQKCYVDVITDHDADVYVDGKYVGTGSLRIYTTCNKYITIMTRKPYYKPAEQTVFVSKPVQIILHPKPVFANVKLEIITPEKFRVESVVMKLDEQVIEWRPGEEKQLLAKPYEVEILQFNPVDACEHKRMNVTFREGSNTLRIFCKLTTSLLALYSEAPTTVKIYQQGRLDQMPVNVIIVEANETKYVPINPGSYTVVSDPVEEGYTTKTLNVTVAEKTVAYLDVTPLPLSKIIVNANVPSAKITITTLEGKEVASGVGKVEAEVFPGTYNVRATAPGYSQYFDVVEVPEGETVVVNATLNPLPPPSPPPQPPIWQRIEFQIGAVALVVGVAVFMLWWRRRKGKVIEAEVSE